MFSPRSARCNDEFSVVRFPNFSDHKPPQRSLVVTMGDFHNARVSIIIEKSHLDELLPRVTALAAKLQMPPATIRVERGRVIGSYELELNERSTRWATTRHRAIPLGAVVEEVPKVYHYSPLLGVAIQRSKYRDVQFPRRITVSKR